MKKKKWPMIFGVITGALVLIVVIVILYIVWFLPSIPVKEIKVESTNVRIERGKYLANHVMVCMDCHSTRDWSKFSGPLIPGTEGRGGEVFDEKLGFPGHFTSTNITPFHLKDWSDAEIYRAITSGVSKDGHPLFPIMPYPAYGTLDTEDIFSVIAYIRSIASIESVSSRSNPTFPMNVILHLIPRKARAQARPSSSDTLGYGEYLVRASGCVECHTPAEHGQIVKTLAFTGGREFQMPDGSMLVSPNITPDEETGIGKWSKEAFIFRFRSYDLSTYKPPVLQKGEIQSIMPWTMYAGMDTTDLVAIYKYLHSLKAVKNKVGKVKPAV
ncbi:MAG: cytochrome C [Bacteroidetes bacterium]|nr:cytochrome C [Bacteroidota bacterium]